LEDEERPGQPKKVENEELVQAFGRKFLSDAIRDCEGTCDKPTSHFETFVQIW